MTDVDKEVINDDKVKEEIVKITPEERAAAWEEHVRYQVGSILDTYLPEAINGNVGVKYVRPVKSVSPKTGKRDFDERKATGVIITLMFDFAAPIEFFDEKPE